MSRTEVALPTPVGDARAFVFKPDSGAGPWPPATHALDPPAGDARAFLFNPAPGAAPWPAAIIAMDAPAIRPALFEMGERLAAAGYYVLLPDLFWRAGPYPPVDI